LEPAVGAVAGAAALKWLLDFVKPNANEAISKWLKPATSEERVVNLYRSLRAVDEASLAFVTALKSLAAAGGQTLPDAASGYDADDPRGSR
jgi:hypothetical protein